MESIPYFQKHLQVIYQQLYKPPKPLAPKCYPFGE